VPIIQQSEWAEQLARAGDFKADLLQRLDDSVSPGIQLDDMNRPEYLWLRRNVPFAAFRSQPATALNFSQISLQYPVLNGLMIAVVESIKIANLSAATDYYNIGLSFGPISAGAQCASTDVRAGGTLSSALRIVQTTSVATAFPGGVGSFVRVAVNAGVTQEVNIPYVLTDRNFGGANPSLFLVVENVTLNRECAVSFGWRERLMLTSER
jgi:hypothetical protein